MDFETIVNVIVGIGTSVSTVTLIYQLKKQLQNDKIKQANLVSSWLDFSDEINDYRAVFSNDSESPIYEVIVSVDDVMDDTLDRIGKGCANCGYVTVLPPGKYWIDIPFGGGGMCHQFNTSITFKDCRGNYWTRTSDGVLHCHEENSTTIRNMELPVIPIRYKKYTL